MVIPGGLKPALLLIFPSCQTVLRLCPTNLDVYGDRNDDDDEDRFFFFVRTYGKNKFVV